MTLYGGLLNAPSMTNSISTAITSTNDIFSQSFNYQKPFGFCYWCYNVKVYSNNVFFRDKKGVRDHANLCHGIRACSESKPEEKQVTKFSPLLESPVVIKNNVSTTELKAIPDIWRLSAERFGDRVALVDPHHDPPTNITYKQLEQDILDFSEGLRVIGIKPCEKVALFADNSCRWLVADQGIMATGAINVVRGSRSSVEELLHIYNHSERSFLDVSGRLFGIYI